MTLSNERTIIGAHSRTSVPLASCHTDEKPSSGEPVLFDSLPEFVEGYLELVRAHGQRSIFIEVQISTKGSSEIDEASVIGTEDAVVPGEGERGQELVQPVDVLRCAHEMHVYG